MKRDWEKERRITIALDTIAHYLSKQWPEFRISSEGFYEITFNFIKKSDQLDEEIIANDFVGVLKNQ